MVAIIPKEGPEENKESNFFFYFVIVFLILSLVGFFILNALLQRADKELADLKKDLVEIMTPERISLEEKVLFWEDKTAKFSLLFERHLHSSGVFGIIQETTHPQVWFSGFKLETGEKELIISGETQNFKTLGQQIFIFEDEPLINKVDLKKFSITRDGKIAFELSLFLKADIFEPVFLSSEEEYE